MLWDFRWGVCVAVQAGIVPSGKKKEGDLCHGRCPGSLLIMFCVLHFTVFSSLAFINKQTALGLRLIPN
jgi:hypothetical protein